jgi:Zn-dependent peptidase ImmA (M78 family)
VGIDTTNDSSVRELALRFGVSQQAVVYCLVDLGLGIDGKADFS